MFIPWKLYSFWINCLAWVCVAAAIILFLASISNFFDALIWLLSGAISFVALKAFAVCTRAAEAYLRNNDMTSDENDSDVDE